MISQDLIDILVCPETKQKLTPADSETVAKINEKIRKGELQNREGRRQKVLSLALIVGSIMVWVQKGSDKFGLDFVGGTEVVGRFSEEIKISDLRKALSEAGFSGAVVQAFEEGTNDFSIRLKAEKGSEVADQVRRVMEEVPDNTFTLLKEDFVGPIIGAQIRTKGIKALVFALVCILIYISFRFEWTFAIGAIIALVHDVIITTGIYVFSDREISAAVLAGLLTIIGYSLNDTIIVYDRIRENLGHVLKTGGADKKPKARRSFSLKELINKSINQTLSRTVLTSVTTLLVVSTLWLLGGGAIVDLAYTLMIGVVVGTYSSIFIASPTILIWAKRVEG